jgi:hypothetical protein
MRKDCQIQRGEILKRATSLHEDRRKRGIEFMQRRK